MRDCLGFILFYFISILFLGLFDVLFCFVLFVFSLNWLAFHPPSFFFFSNKKKESAPIVSMFGFSFLKIWTVWKLFPEFLPL